MKKTMVWLLALLMVLASVLPVFAAEGNVTYDGRARDFIFEPGSEYSPTDLFPNYKDVMPGDTLRQRITVKNSGRYRVEIWLRALGAHEESEEFLSQLRLQVVQEEDTELFDAPADETAQLTDWVSLGKFRPGARTTLNVTLEVPVELDNRFSYAIGYLDWQFRVVELPTGGGGEEPEEPFPEEPQPEEPGPEEPAIPDQPQPDTPHTGDDFQLCLWLSMTVIGGAMSLCLLAVLLIRKKKSRKE